MARIVRTARGEQVDFDALIIKQQLAQAPMNIEVAKRKLFIDQKEGKTRGAQKAVPPKTVTLPIAEAVSAPVKSSDFEIPDTGDGIIPNIDRGPIEAVPIIPERKKK